MNRAKDQFDYISDYLGWDILFYKPFYATGADDIKNNDNIVEELIGLGRSI